MHRDSETWIKKWQIKFESISLTTDKFWKYFSQTPILDQDYYSIFNQINLVVQWIQREMSVYLSWQVQRLNLERQAGLRDQEGGNYVCEGQSLK